MKHFASCAAVAIVFCASVASAREPTPDEVDRARTFFNAGAQAYTNAQYGDAARSFEQAYTLAPRPPILFSLAQSERKQFFATNDAAMLKRAIAHYKDYLDQVPSGGRRSEATEAKADLESRLARLDPQQAAAVKPEAARKPRVTVYSATPGAKATIDGGAPQDLPYFGDLEPGMHRVRVFADGYFDEERPASGDKPGDIPIDVSLKDRPALVAVAWNGTGDVLVDGHVVATAPVPRPIEVAPGPHVLSISANGKKAFSQDVTLERGKPFRFEPKLETSGQRLVALSMLGLGAAGLVTGTVFAFLAVGQEGDAKDILDKRVIANIPASDLDKYNHSLDQRDAFRTVSIVSLSAGVALAAGGVALFVLDKPNVNVVPPRTVEPTPPPRPAQSLDVAAIPILGPSTWGAGVVGRF